MIESKARSSPKGVLRDTQEYAARYRKGMLRDTQEYAARYRKGMLRDTARGCYAIATLSSPCTSCTLMLPVCMDPHSPLMWIVRMTSNLLFPFPGIWVPSLI
ncbi:MAG: hypothetical protein Q7J07_02315 [Pelolinea sp.]|nr:hypothetical protein [Pelolinea sp.]